TSGGALTLSNNNAQSWGGDWTFLGSNNLNLGTGSVTLLANRVLAVSAAVLVIGGAVGGAFRFTKNGAGTLTLNGNSTYSGGFTLGAGTLNIGHAAAVGTGTLTINGGTL